MVALQLLLSHRWIIYATILFEMLQLGCVWYARVDWTRLDFLLLGLFKDQRRD